MLTRYLAFVLACCIALCGSAALSYAAVAGAANIGSGSAGGATPAPDAQLDDVLKDPVAAYNDVKALYKLGWPFALLGGLVVVLRGVGTASKRWPKFPGLAKLASGKLAVVIASATTIVVVAFNALALGGTWPAILFAAGVAGFALWSPDSPAPSSESPAS